MRNFFVNHPVLLAIILSIVVCGVVVWSLWLSIEHAMAEDVARRERADVLCNETCETIGCRRATVSSDNFGNWTCSCYNPRTETIHVIAIEP